MATYLDMQTRIADELDRSDLTAQIKKAILTSVDFYAGRNFYFSDSSFTFSTVAGQEYYGTADNAAIATAPGIDFLNGSYNGLRVQLTKRPFGYINQISVLPSTSRAQPRDWAYRAEQIRLYPIPDAVYTMTAFYTPRLTALSADADSNVWTNDAEELIRTRAKIDLIRNVIRGSDMVQEIAMLKEQEQDALSNLFGEGASRSATGFAQPTVF